MKKRKISSSFLNESHSLARKDLIGAQLETCTDLIKYATYECDLKAAKKEINELKMALDVMIRF